MVQPASRDDFMRVVQMLETLDKRIARSLEVSAKQFERLQQTLDAALEAITEERIENESDFQSSLHRAIEELGEDIKKVAANLRQYLLEAEVDHQKMRRFLENNKSNKRYG